MRSSRLLVALAAAAVAAVAWAAPADELVTLSRCAERGFAPGAVACSTCEKLEAAVAGNPAGAAVVEDCHSCCASTLDAVSPVRFARAELTVCRFSLGNHGGVNEFLEKSPFKDSVVVVDVAGGWRREQPAGGGARWGRWTDGGGGGMRAGAQALRLQPSAGHAVGVRLCGAVAASLSPLVPFSTPTSSFGAGASPSLTLRGGAGHEPALTLPVAGWKVEQIDAFLRLKTTLKGDAAA